MFFFPRLDWWLWTVQDFPSKFIVHTFSEGDVLETILAISQDKHELRTTSKGVVATVTVP